MKTVKTMNSCKKIFALAFFILLLSSLAGAQILLGISPKDKTKTILVLYPEETGALELSVLNAGPEARQITMKITASGDSIAFLENGNMQKEIARQFFLPQNAMQIIELQAIALKESPEIQAVAAELDSNYGSLSGSFIKIVPSPLKIQTGTAAIDRGFGSIRIKAENDSNQTIQNLKIELIPFAGTEAETGALETGALQPKQGIEKEFRFFINMNLEEQKTILLQASFYDANGFHIMQRKIGVQGAQFFEIIAFALVLLIIALALFAATKIFLKKKPAEAKPAEKKQEKK